MANSLAEPLPTRHIAPAAVLSMQLVFIVHDDFPTIHSLDVQRQIDDDQDALACKQHKAHDIFFP